MTRRSTPVHNAALDLARDPAHIGSPVGVPTRRAPVAWILTGAAIAAAVATVAAIALFSGNGMVQTSMPGWTGGVFVATALAVAAGAWATLVDRRDPARGPRHEAVVRIVVTVVLIVLLLAQLTTLQQVGVAGFVYALMPIFGHRARVLVDADREVARAVGRARAAHPRGAAQRDRRAPARLGAADARAHPEPRGRLERGRPPRPRAGARAARLALRRRRPRRQRPRRPTCATTRPPSSSTTRCASTSSRPGCPAERASGEVAAAAREAMLNAARHAGGDVSVYIEGNASAVDVYVRDRGPGFDLAGCAGRPARRPSSRSSAACAAPADRRRCGPGWAACGTEVHLRFAADAARAHRRRPGAEPAVGLDRAPDRRCTWLMPGSRRDRRRPLDLPVGPARRPRRLDRGRRRGRTTSAARRRGHRRDAAPDVVLLDVHLPGAASVPARPEAAGGEVVLPRGGLWCRRRGSSR